MDLLEAKSLSKTYVAEEINQRPDVTAISGNGDTVSSMRHKSNLNLCRVEWTLGFHHAASSKKNLLLMISSFAFSIILFLCFSVGLELVYELLPSLRQSGLILCSVDMRMN